MMLNIPRIVLTVALALTILTTTAVVRGAEHSITDYGAIAGDDSSTAIAQNLQAINTALQSAQPGDTVLIPEGLRFFTVGGIQGNNLTDVTVRFDGALSAVPDFDLWPLDNGDYAHFVQFMKCVNLTITALNKSSLAIDGQGLPWWNKFILGKLKNKRPKLLAIRESEHLLIENLHLLNSPSFHLLLQDVAYAEVRYVSILVERDVQRDLKQILRDRWSSREGQARGFPLQPEDLNTDGIDPSGHDIWIHDCSIVNDDDSIAVKPCSSSSCTKSSCTENVLMENLVLTGFGASIGSVPPHPDVNCVRNITFRNISMPETGKGIYIKSNPQCDGNNSAVLENILYEDINITKPRWWGIWIGPQQQHEPNSALGDKCALDYPISPHCPTQGCATFNNITLRRVTVTDSLLSPGVIRGNASNPMTNILFDSVKYINPGSFPFKGEYQCENVHGTVINSDPIPSCFTQD